MTKDLFTAALIVVAPLILAYFAAAPVVHKLVGPLLTALGH